MSIRKKLRSNPYVRRFVKQTKIYREYFHDAQTLSQNLLDGGGANEHVEYRILLDVHALEKGLSNSSPRAFGAKRIASLLNELDNAPFEVRSSTAYAMALSVLEAWFEFHRTRDDRDLKAFERVANFLDDRPKLVLPSPITSGVVPNGASSYKAESSFSELVRSRHSTRIYDTRQVPRKTIEESVEEALRSPSACNRQMIQFHVIDDPAGKQYLYKLLHGTGGIHFESARLGLVTFDTRSLDFYGERNQGYFNAGLFAMTLVYSLQSRGVSSCLLQFGNTFSEETRLKQILRIEPPMRIAVAMAFGHSPESSLSPASHRKPTQDILFFHSQEQ